MGKKNVIKTWRNPSFGPLAPRINGPNPKKTKILVKDNCELCIHYNPKKGEKKKSCPYRKDKKKKICEDYENAFDSMSLTLAKERMAFSKKKVKETVKAPIMKKRKLKTLKDITNVTISFEYMCPKCKKRKNSEPKRILAPYIGNVPISHHCDCGNVIQYKFVIRKAKGGFEAKVKIKGYRKD